MLSDTEYLSSSLISLSLVDEIKMEYHEFLLPPMYTKSENVLPDPKVPTHINQ